MIAYNYIFPIFTENNIFQLTITNIFIMIVSVRVARVDCFTFTIMTCCLFLTLLKTFFSS